MRPNSFVFERASLGIADIMAYDQDYQSGANLGHVNGPPTSRVRTVSGLLAEPAEPGGEALIRFGVTPLVIVKSQSAQASCYVHAPSVADLLERDPSLYCLAGDGGNCTCLLHGNTLCTGQPRPGVEVSFIVDFINPDGEVGSFGPHNFTVVGIESCVSCAPLRPLLCNKGCSRTLSSTHTPPPHRKVTGSRIVAPFPPVVGRNSSAPTAVVRWDDGRVVGAEQPGLPRVRALGSAAVLNGHAHRLNASLLNISVLQTHIGFRYSEHTLRVQSLDYNHTAALVNGTAQESQEAVTIPLAVEYDGGSSSWHLFPLYLDLVIVPDTFSLLAEGAGAEGGAGSNSSTGAGGGGGGTPGTVTNSTGGGEPAIGNDTAGSAAGTGAPSLG